jgi:hypothetical protein
VIADEVALLGQLPRDRGICLCPAALDEERGGDVVSRQRLRESSGCARLGRSIGVLRVECQRDLRRPRGLACPAT